MVRVQMTLCRSTRCRMSHTCVGSGHHVCLMYMQPHLELEQKLLCDACSMVDVVVADS